MVFCMSAVSSALAATLIRFTKPHLARADCTERVWRCSQDVFCVLDGAQWNKTNSKEKKRFSSPMQTLCPVSNQ